MQPSLPEAVLLVDGYNIIGAWSYLTKTRDRLGLEAARGELVSALTNYSALQGYETQVVFDSQYQNTSSSQEMINQNLSVHYTNFGQTADTYIEKSCAALRPYLKQSHRCRLIVATNDRVQQLVVVGYGAEWMSAHQLNYEVESTLKISLTKHRQRKQSASRFLANSIDAKARQKLAQLRMGL